MQHGRASVVITPEELVELAGNQINKVSLSGLKWKGSPSVKLISGKRLIKIRVKGVVEQTWPDTVVKIDIYFRPYVAGEHKVKVSYHSWWAESDGSAFGYANSTILGEIRKYFENHGSSLADSINEVLEEQLARLDDITAFAKNDINIRRVNVLPEGLEVVLSDTEIGVSL
ncbi:MAG: hypothetical protein KAX49_07020 [Halanaerobiales bacterium]|nr:hypothetical protein [Halanaerobiales bacterium]